MANRGKLRVHDWKPAKGASSWQDPRPDVERGEAANVRRTMSNKHYEGIDEARRSGMQTSRRVALGLANNGVPHHEAVATDHRIRKQEEERIRREARFRRLHRKIDPTLE